MTPQPPSSAPRRLIRPSDDRMLAGVASGLARHFDLDPALVRIAFVVLALFGGSGALLYLILALILPSDTGPARIGPGASGVTRAVLAALVVLALLSLFNHPGLLYAGPAALLCAVVGALGVLLWRAVGGRGHSTLVRASLVLLILVGAALVGGGAGLASALGAGTAVAVAVIVLGAALVVGGLLGGARWLVVPALLLAAPLAFVSAAGIDLRGGVGQRSYRPATMTDLAPSYRLGVGELRLDLRDTALPPGPTPLHVHVGVGHAVVRVPAGVCVQTRAHVGAGQIVRFGRRSGGVDVQVDERRLVPADRPQLVLDASLGMGQLDIRGPGQAAACRS